MVPRGGQQREIICGDTLGIAGRLSKGFVDLLVLDPPCNLSKNCNGHMFRAREGTEYRRWFECAINCLLSTLKPTATLYVCSDWKTSVLLTPILESRFHVRNRIA